MREYCQKKLRYGYTVLWSGWKAGSVRLSKGEKYGTVNRLKGDFALKAREHLLFGDVPHYAEGWPRAVPNRGRQAKPVLEHPDCQHDLPAARHGHVNYPSCNADAGSGWGAGWLLWWRRHATADGYRD